jgi:hypothetical protein
MVLPDALVAVWHGCGGSTTSGTAAALKLQVRLELRTGQLEGPDGTALRGLSMGRVVCASGALGTG